ncbi:MAG: AmmeMemoRadiSam system protein B, partial [Candidatus Coatesbacteria bacterium]
MAKAVFITLAAAAMVFAATACKKEAVEEGAAPPETPGAAAEVKPPNVAGTFYPGEAEALRADVEARLAAGEATLPAEDVVALLTPHAGYVYSGGVAATAFREVRGRQPATVVLLGPSHHCARREIATATYDGFETPLGVVDVDGEFVEAVAEKCAEVAYTNVPFAQEHCLEVQLPFLQTLFPEAKVAPFIFCRHDREAAEHFGEALAEVIAAREAETLLVVT